MGKRGRSDSDDERDRRHSSHKSRSHKKDHKRKDDRRDRSRERSKSPASRRDSQPNHSSAPAEGNDEADRKRKRLEAWKAMQSSVKKPAEDTPAAAVEPAPAPAAPAQAPVSVGSFKMGLKAASKPGGFKPGGFKLGLGTKKAAPKPSFAGFGAEDDEEKPKLRSLPPLSRQISMFSPPSSPTPNSPPGMSDLDDDVDPLDAFMTGISQEVKESIGDLTLSGPSTMRQREQEQEQSKLQTVSMDDILAGKVGGDAAMGDEDEDRLDADRQNFMEAIRADREDRARKEQEEQDLRTATEEKERLAALEKAKQEHNTGRFLDSEEEEEYWVDVEEEEQKYLDALHKKKLAKELPPVDHDSIDYPDFQRAFYIETADIKKMSEDEISEYREEMDQIKIRGKDCPRPIKKWTQCGLSGPLLTVLKKMNYDAPFAIQCQALPAIMSGRDVIGVAKTGSGKTLAFVLPMLRHIKAQPPLLEGEGPIGLIMAPTRELAVQIFTECRKLSKPLNLTPVCAYGGAPMSQQVGDIKAGAEIIVCTPGRCIDLLTLNSGRVMNLQRTTYVVLDEADRMFDMGFEPQVQKIIRNIRPDHQTVMFSATFPKVVEKHAKAILENPVQIVCGGVSVVSNTIEQHIEVVNSENKLKRLLELLAEWYNLGENILLFVDRQEDADELFRDLIKAGYVALTLHGGKDQNDRDHTLADFKNKDNTLMVATSVAARGLDVKDLSLVVNYHCPNHYEDYVHRVGRTGRAGKKGTAWTFIEPEEDQYASDLVRALELANVTDIPKPLLKLVDCYKLKEQSAYAMGTSLKKSSGFTSTKGYKFDEAEGKANKDKGAQARGMVREYTEDEDLKSMEKLAAAGEAAAAEEAAAPVDTAAQLAAAMAAAQAMTEQNAKAEAEKAAQPAPERRLTAGADIIAQAQKKAAEIAEAAKPAAPNNMAAALAAAQAIQMKINQAAQQTKQKEAAIMHAIPGADRMTPAQLIAAKISMSAGFETGVGLAVDDQGNVVMAHNCVELEINDYPQQARWKVTHKDSINSITDNYAVSVTTKGSFFQPGRNPPPGERKLYLTIEGSDIDNVNRAKRELRRMLEEAAAGVRETGTAGRYSV
eukprot:TRINITY_DN6726_c0_g2_i1.p1 TRINITY_DN6726_c0_g2~~TRINITY_DN6726_c0_g2_i1.p1  ORF type:complete len:1103 (-),score=340.09 TRINITY_DN6726_c0_g2_i1:159-3467(-)